MDVSAYLKRRKQWVDQALRRWIPASQVFPPQIHEAMHYSLGAGGKRLRPILALAAAEAVGGKAKEVLPLACALELIHTYSLIHDDLPAMDDDDWRRGKPTCHKVYGEAIAILTGDALLTEAFRLLTRRDLMKGISPLRRLRAINLLAEAAGSLGMIGGQTMDILSQGKPVEKELLEYIHRHKTGALMIASVCAGGLLGGASESQLKALAAYGENLGLAFQIKDDLLDVQGKKGKMGKAVGKDAARGKATYPALWGVAGACRRAEELIQKALEALAPFNRHAQPLRAIARFVLEREH
jgi:geranylgeranyl diphosphate synthase type II